MVRRFTLPGDETKIITRILIFSLADEYLKCDLPFLPFVDSKISISRNNRSRNFSENGNLRAHYTKTTVRAGEVLRLAAVFQDTRRAPVSGGVSGVVGGAAEGKSSRSSERDQYAQCLDSHGHELFAPLSARGEFYATCQSGSLDTGSDAVLYRVHQLARRDLPLRVRRNKKYITPNLPTPFVYSTYSNDRCKKI